MDGVQMSRVAVSEHSIAYRRAGEGPPVVLLHGFLCDSRCWREQFAALSDVFTVIAWDAPGAGASSDPHEPFTIGDWAQALARFLDEIGHPTAAVVGLSWGGMLAQELYRLDPRRVERLVLADTYVGWKGSLPQEVVEQRLARCYRDAARPVVDVVSEWVPTEFFAHASTPLVQEMATVFSDFHPAGFRLMARSLADTDTSDILPTIQAPTLLLWGEEDKRSPLNVAEQFHAGIAGSSLEIIPSAGHVSNMERPDLFNRSLRRFLLPV